MLSKPLFALLLILHPLMAMNNNNQAEPTVLKSGTYVCLEGNDDSICPQKVTTQLNEDGDMQLLKVIYSGYCADYGPLKLYCQEDRVCERPGQRIEIKDSTHYYWENTSYDIFCHFEYCEEDCE